jgi:hypothetical protein
MILTNPDGLHTGRAWRRAALGGHKHSVIPLRFLPVVPLLVVPPMVSFMMPLLVVFDGFDHRGFAGRLLERGLALGGHRRQAVNREEQN